MDKVLEWREIKGEIYSLARKSSEVISEVAERIFAECAQRVKTTFYLERGEAEAVVYGGGFEISGHAPKSILSSHWSGSLEDWSVVKGEIQRLTNPETVRKELVERL